MEKQTLNKLTVIGFAIFAILVLVLGDVFMVGLNKPQQQTNNEYIQGVMEANYQIESFKGIVKVINPVDFSNISQNISLISGVKKVYDNVDEILILTENENASSDIYKLIENRYGNVLIKAVLTPEGQGKINRTIDVNVSMPLEVYLKPSIGKNSTVVIIADVAAQNGEIVAMQNSYIASKRETLTIESKILNSTEGSYVYQVDFENRTQISGIEGNYTKEISNIAFLTTTPTVKQDYATWLGDKYVIVTENMTNKTKINEDYGNATFQYSTIRSSEPLNLSFVVSESKTSIVNVLSKDKQYILPNNGILNIEMTNVTENMTGVNLVLDAEVSGNLVMDYIITAQYPVYS